MKFKNLGRYRTGGTRTNMKLALPIPRTPDGRVYRYSPNETAFPRHFVMGDFDKLFVVNEAAQARMKLVPRSNQSVCPYSGQVASDQDFMHPDDVKAALKIVEHAAFSDIEDELAQMLGGFGSRSSGNSFLKIETKVTKTHRPKPRFARRDLLRELVCDHCSRDYGVFAIGLFCPDCGAPNLRLHFAREAELVSAQVVMADALGDGQEELAYRLLGNAHEDVLTAFEATLKAVYAYGMNQRGADAAPYKEVKNEFQNIDFARKRFADLSLDPFDELSEAEIATLALNIQKRHIIGHNLGVVDDKFAAHAQDAKIGETVRLVGEDIRRFANISQRVIDRLDSWLAGAPSPSLGEPGPVSGDESAVEGKVSTNETPTESADQTVNLAESIAIWMAKTCVDGSRRYAPQDQLLETFSDWPERVIAEALAELEADGFVETRGALGLKIPHVRPTVDLYATYDPMALGTNPVSDACELTGKILAGADSVSVAALHASTEWPLRRFNPAIALVIAEIHEGRVSGERGHQYPAGSFFLMAPDRVALKRFVAARR